MRIRTVAVLLVAALLACSRPQPSPEYERARQLWTGLVRERGDAAAEDAGADEVLSLLARVAAQSLDAPAAAELRGRIEADRAAAAEERARRARLVEGAGALRATEVAGAAERAPQPAGPRAPALVPGLGLEDFRAAYGSCFDARGPVQIEGAEEGQGARGEMWSLGEDQGCREEHAGLAGKVLLFSGGKLAAVVPEGKLERREVRREVEIERLPGGDYGERTAGGAVPLPPGARLMQLDGGAW